MLDPSLTTSLISVGISAGSVIILGLGAKIIDKIFPANKRKDKKTDKVDSAISDSAIKVSDKVLKTAPVTVNTEKIIELIEEAEDHPFFSSVEKLDYVLTKYQQYCIDNNFKYIKEVITDNVTKLIEMTKKVNKRPKDEAREQAEKAAEEKQEPVEIESTEKGIYS